MAAETGHSAPVLPWRISSAVVTGLVGSMSRAMLLACNKVEVNGLDGFLELLRQREDVQGRQRGLVSVSNHSSVLDDPLMWGVIPFKYHFNPNNVRWSLGSHDIVFKNKAFSTFFSLGQTLPTHRMAHSQFGGLFQPTITQTIRLLSKQPFAHPLNERPDSPTMSDATNIEISSDPFTDPSVSTYTTNYLDTFPCPSYYSSRRHAWVHIFPEGRIHQHPDRIMRYFKWGVSRLILEAQPAPTLVPIWIEGFDQVMHESRTFPRFIPRIGKKISITFGNSVETEELCGDLRRRWQELVKKETQKKLKAGAADAQLLQLSILESEVLKYGEEAQKLREECTFRVREEVLKLRRQRGWDDEDPKARFVDTWKQEGLPYKREGQMEDGSWIRDT